MLNSNGFLIKKSKEHNEQNKIELDKVFNKNIKIKSIMNKVLLSEKLENNLKSERVVKI